MEQVVIPSPCRDAGPDFVIGESLTIFEAAMVYTDRHPHGAFLRDGTTNDYCKFIGAGRIRDASAAGGTEEEQRRRRTWDVLCELLERIRSGTFVPTLRGVMPDGSIDWVRTKIPTAVLLELAKQRGDGGTIVSRLATSGYCKSVLARISHTV